MKTRNSKTTKRSLTASITSVLLCLILLIGATFAWFTDSVTSGRNRIVAGNLDVELEYATAFGENGEITQWTEVDSDTSLFSELEADDSTENLWEPGHTEVVYLRTRNAGALALQYNFTVNIASETPGTNVDDQAFNLSDYLVFGQADNVTAKYDTREDAWTAAGNTLGLEEYTQTNIVLNPGAEKTVALIVYMPESVGNAANYKTGTDAPEIDLGVSLVATQTPYESDSFDNQYDADAAYPVITTISDGTSLSDALNNPGVSTEITVPADISGVRDDLNVTGDVTLHLGDSQIYNITPLAGTDINVEEGGSLTINANNGGGFNYTAGKLAASGADSSLTVNGGNYGDSGAGNAEVSAADGAVVTLNEGSFSTSGAGGSAVKATGGSTMYINGGSYSSSGAGSIVMLADGGTIIIESYDFILANGSNFGAVNGGEIHISKAFLSAQPTKIAAGCTVSDGGEYWIISEQ